MQDFTDDNESRDQAGTRADSSPEAHDRTGPEPGVPDPVAALSQDFVLSEKAGGAHSTQVSREINRQSFHIGELGLLCRWEDSREVIQPPAVSRLPNTPSWLKGLANVRGGLTPVVDLADAMGIARQDGATPYLLIFGEGEQSMGVLIDGLPRPVVLTTEERLGTLPTVPSLMRHSVGAAYEHQGSVWFDLDVHSLFERMSQRLAA